MQQKKKGQEHRNVLGWHPYIAKKLNPAKFIPTLSPQFKEKSAHFYILYSRGVRKSQQARAACLR